MTAAMLLAGCDKISSDEYVQYDGAVISWTETQGTLDPVQRAYVEKYTGPRCTNCPSADATLEQAHAQYGDRLVVVSVNHPTGQGVPFPGDPDMRTDGGNAWDSYFRINAIPAALLNRNTSTMYTGPMSNIIGDIGTALQATPALALQADASASGNEVHVSVSLQLQRYYNSPLTITAALVEDSLVYRQLLPDGSLDEQYAHNHMLRKVVTSFWGRDLPSPAASGSVHVGHFSFGAPEDVNLANSHVVIFVSDKASRRVINCTSAEID